MTSSSQSRRGQSRQGGIALVTGLIFLVFVSLVVGTTLMISATNSRATGDQYKTTQAQYAAEAGIEKVVQQYYYDLMQPEIPALAVGQTQTEAAKSLTLAKYREKLSTAYPDLAPGATAEEVDEAKIYKSDPAKALTVTGETADGKFKVKITRQDINAKRGFSVLSSRRTELNIEATGVTGTVPDLNNIPASATQRIVKQTLYITDSTFQGIDFALLSNNVNCIFCHAYVTTMEDAYNPTRTNKITRVKVATLQNLEMRTGGSPDSYIGGTLYTRGAFKIDGSGGTDFVSGDMTSLSTKTHDVDISDGKVGTTKTDLSWNDCAVATCVKNKNFYKNYPATGGADGEIPEFFPLPIYDENANRVTDDDEWQSTVKGETGGTLKGGTKQLFAKDVAYTASAVQTATLTVTYSDTAKNGIDGNLVLNGPRTNPLEISGSIYVNGDVIISGWVKGSGTIIARGNIYVVGDLEYHCSDTAICDYKTPSSLPLLGLVAVGNISVGDLYTPRVRFAKDSGQWIPQPNGTSNGTASPNPYTANAWSGTGVNGVNNSNYIEPIVTTNAAVTTLDSFTRTVPGTTITKTITGRKITLAAAGLGGGSVNVDGNASRRYGISFPAGQLALFNQGEYLRAKNNTNYVPRYYKFGGDPFFQTTNAEEPNTYDNIRAIPSSELSRSITTTKGSTTPVVADVAPGKMTSGAMWISLQTLKGMWVTNIETPTRPNTPYNTSNLRFFSTNTSSKAKPLSIDALLYSSNAIFSLARADSKVRGSTILNGSLVGADVGFLSGGRDGGNGTTSANMQYGIRLQYDSRFQSVVGLGAGISLLRSSYTQGTR
jgi:Tfp pilus assembly protein PilX